jgi:glycosyltransferase involved in cell wall biosynthesis
VHVLLDYLKTLQGAYRFELIIVNDGSRDETGSIAGRLAAESAGVRVIHHPRNFGLGQALKTGFGQCRGRYVVVLDIDLSYGPEHVGLLLERMAKIGARLVLASPYMHGGRVVAVPWLRIVFSRVANWFLARASGERISTMTCMVRAFDGRFLRSMHLRNTGMDVMPRVAARAYLHFALAACRVTGTQPSILLHPLDFMGGEDCPALAFFPGMDIARAEKLGKVAELFDVLAAKRELVTMGEHARRAGAVRDALPTLAPVFPA